MSGQGSGAGSLGEGWIRRAPDEPGCERIEAFFAGRGYEMHRHDTYAIGRTLSGVQSFHYRGARRDSVPGGTIVLHPDEVHDGQAGAEGGFYYRMIYIEPAQIQSALGGKPLPYVPNGISQDARLFAAIGTLLGGLDHRFDELEYADAVGELATALDGASDSRAVRVPGTPDYAAAQRARAYLDDMAETPVSLGDLEAAAGASRWQLSRDFRRFFGTSPHRYLVMRRLGRVKGALKSGMALAEAAADAGFADQSHMSRHFKRAYGMTPAHWVKLLAA